MEMNAEFKKLTRGFHQNMFRDSASLQDMASEALLSIEPQDVSAVKTYLDELLSGNYSGTQLQDIWRHSLADIYFSDDQVLLEMLRLLRSTISVHPYLNRSE
jgi:hypothetical protein